MSHNGQKYHCVRDVRCAGPRMKVTGHYMRTWHHHRHHHHPRLRCSVAPLLLAHPHWNNRTLVCTPLTSRRAKIFCENAPRLQWLVGGGSCPVGSLAEGGRSICKLDASDVTLV